MWDWFCRGCARGYIDDEIDDPGLACPRCGAKLVDAAKVRRDGSVDGEGFERRSIPAGSPIYDDEGREVARTTEPVEYIAIGLRVQSEERCPDPPRPVERKDDDRFTVEDIRKAVRKLEAANAPPHVCLGCGSRGYVLFGVGSTEGVVECSDCGHVERVGLGARGVLWGKRTPEAKP